MTGRTLSLSKGSVQAVALAACMTVVINVHGFARVFAAVKVSSGAWNVLLLPTMAVAASCLWLLQRRSLTLRRSDAVLLMLGACSFCLLVLYGALLHIGLETVDASKLARDVVSLWALVALGLLGLGWQRQMARTFAVWLFGLNVVVMPVLWLTATNGLPSDRLSSFVLSASNFAVITVFIVHMLYQSGIQWRTMLLGLLFASGVVVWSGTRTALLPIVSLSGVFIWDVTRKRLRPVLAVVLLGCVLSGVAYVVGTFGDDYAPLLQNARVFAWEDAVEPGSITSRVYWIERVFGEMETESVFGGAGAGASERLTGNLVHFELLRYWYDYSILYPTLVLLILGYSGFVAWRRWRARELYGISLFATVLLATVHNAFQDAAVLGVMAMTVSFPGKMVGASGPGERLRRNGERREGEPRYR